MPSRSGPASPSLVAGSWRRPAFLTLLAVLTAAGSLHHHRSAGSVLAAVLCLAFAVQMWCLWHRARARPPDAGRRLDD